MTNTRNNSLTDQLDLHIREIAKRGLDNRISQTEARWAISEALIEADIPAYVSRTAVNINTQQRADLAEKLQEVIERATHRETDGGLSLEKIVNDGSSASAWARGLAKSAIKSSLREIRRDTTVRFVNIDPTDGNDVERTRGYAESMFHTASTGISADLDEMSQEDEDNLDVIFDEFTEAAAGLRPAGRLRLSAAALIKQYNVPELIRPADSFDREWVRLEVEEDETLALRSVMSMYRLVAEKQTPDDRLIDERLMSLWDDYSAEDLAKFESYPKVAHQLVLASVSPLPRPSRDIIALALRTIRMADDGDDWKTLTRQLLDSWLAIEVEATSAFDTKGTKDTERAEARLAAAFAWPELARAMAARPGAPLGDSEQAISKWISTTVQTMS
jgi:hypothetical protein